MNIVLIVKFYASKTCIFHQIKRRYSINESDAFYGRLFYSVPSVIIGMLL